jgi:glycosyltransferase involved in cell wall biosynthesis
MRILLASGASYLPPRGGATRSNLTWLKRLVACGHECRAVVGALADEEARRLQLVQEQISFRLRAGAAGVEEAEHDGVILFSCHEPARRLRVLRTQIAEFRPHWVLVSSEDLGHVLLREAFRGAPGRVVYLAHTPQWFPFGPESWNRDPEAASLLKGAAAIVAIGRHMARYIETHLGRPAAVVHPPIYPPPPWPRWGRFGQGFVVLVNPCAVKGISIFLELARRFPGEPFAVVPGWGTTSGDRQALSALPNVSFLPNFADIEELFRRTRVLLMPSLWYEGFGLTAMEAMLRGVPVLASDSGGLREAMEGTDGVVPVSPIVRYEPDYDEHALPRPVFAPTDIAPWERALARLLCDREAYEQAANAARRRAELFVSGIDPDGMERFLAGLKPLDSGGAAGARPSVEALTPQQRALLLERLKHRKPGS